MAARKASRIGSIFGCMLLAWFAFQPAVRADDDKKPAGNAVQAPLTEKQLQLLMSVQRGVIYLKATQNPVGNWGKGQHPVGYAAMPALAMLEVGVPANDVSVQAAAAYVRTMVPTLDKTYELSLAILFLHQLGDRRDVPLIQAMALRLMAGQTVNGGWSYDCPILNAREEQLLALYCKTNQPRFNPLTKNVTHPYLMPLPKSQESLIDPEIRKEKADVLTDPLQNPLPNLIPKDPTRKPDSTAPNEGRKTEQKDSSSALVPPPSALPNGSEPKKGGDSTRKAPASPNNPTKDPFLAIHDWPSVPAFVAKSMRPGLGLGPKKDDNSNTQFAVLALWAARNYRVPVGLTLVRLDQRFRTTQINDGAWSYQADLFGVAAQLPGPKHKFHKGTPPMTCVGLLGLGVGHGAFQEAAIAQNKNPTPANYMFDPAIQKGLVSLSKSVGPNHFNPQGTGLNLYYFWSLERVAVLYHLPTLGGVDWHAWGSDLIMSRQQINGSWAEKGYVGSSEAIDTSMALLFLSRANLNRDLSESLRRYIVVVDPSRANNP